MALVSVRNLTRGSMPRIAFDAIADSVLPKDYELSVVLVGKTKSQALNMQFRGKNKPANVLAFPNDKKFGEIFIAPNVARKQASKFGKTETGFLAFLFIHALLHLKGHDHGDTMERAERRLCQKFNIS